MVFPTLRAGYLTGLSVWFGCMFSLALAPPLAEARTYRWVDENGSIHYTDRLPPAEVHRGYTELGDQGTTLKTVPPAPTPDELRYSQEQEHFRAEEARRLDREQAADQALLETYRSIEDLSLARDGKLAAIDARIQVERGHLRREQAQLRVLHRHTIEFTKTGKPISPSLETEIIRIEGRLLERYASILEEEQQKDRLRREFDRILTRYRALRQLPNQSAAQTARGEGSDLRNLVNCPARLICDATWSQALDYVRARVKSSDDILRPNLLMKDQRDEREDRVITLVRIPGPDGESAAIFLDLQCQNRLTADVTCLDNATLQVLDGFRDALAAPSP